MTSRAGSSFAAFPSFDVSAVSALAPGETGSVAPASPIVPCRGCELAKSELQPGVAYQNSSSRRSASPDLATGVSREEVLGDFTRVGAPRAVRYRARGRHGGENRIAGHREHLRRRVHWSFTLGKQLTNHSPARRGSIFSSAAEPRRSSSLSNRHGTHQTRRGPARPSTHASGSSTRAARSDARSSRRFTSRGRSRARRGFQNSKERKVGIGPRRAW